MEEHDTAFARQQLSARCSPEIEEHRQHSIERFSRVAYTAGLDKREIDAMLSHAAQHGSMYPDVLLIMAITSNMEQGVGFRKLVETLISSGAALESKVLIGRHRSARKTVFEIACIKCSTQLVRFLCCRYSIQSSTFKDGIFGALIAEQNDTVNYLLQERPQYCHEVTTQWSAMGMVQKLDQDHANKDNARGGSENRSSILPPTNIASASDSDDSNDDLSMTDGVDKIYINTRPYLGLHV
jgi:hypothetical protein